MRLAEERGQDARQETVRVIIYKRQNSGGLLVLPFPGAGQAVSHWTAKKTVTNPASVTGLAKRGVDGGIGNGDDAGAEVLGFDPSGNIARVSQITPEGAPWHSAAGAPER